MNAMFHRYRFQSWETTELVDLLLSPEAKDVLSCWLTDTRFLDENFEPALLPLAQEDGTGLLDLVMRAGKDISAVRVLNELLDSGLVEQATVGIFLLRRAAYMPSSSDHQKGNAQDIMPGRPGKAGNRAGYWTRHTDCEFWKSTEQTSMEIEVGG